MRRFLFFCTIGLFTSSMGFAQDFITRGKIEFEVKRNIKRMYADAEGANSSDMGSVPDFDASYRELVFIGNQSIYLPGRKSSNPSHYNNESIVYTDLDKGEIVKKWAFIDDYYVYSDSVKKVKWKIENETRKIAGWECRKAIGRIFDSVYVVAFYCPEIIPQSGPELFSGLPGMILGLAIPRYYSTWFATSIELASIDESKIVPPSIKKSKAYTKKELTEILYKKYKGADWWKEVTIEKVTHMLDSYTL